MISRAFKTAICLLGFGCCLQIVWISRIINHDSLLFMCQIDAVDLEVRKVTIILILEFSGLIYKHNELNILVADMCCRASSVIYIVLYVS